MSSSHHYITHIGRSQHICNIDLLKFSTHDKTETFLNNMFIQGYVPTITMPTRVTHQSATLIDNIFTNKPTHEDLTGILDDRKSFSIAFLAISDQYATF